MTATYSSLLAGSTSTGLYAMRGGVLADLVAQADAAHWQAMTLDTTRVESFEQFYDEVASSWDLPPWFGRNLDALFDVLVDLTDQPTVLVWNGLTHLAGVDQTRAEAILQVLRDAIGEATRFAVVLVDDPSVNGLDALL